MEQLTPSAPATTHIPEEVGCRRVSQRVSSELEAPKQCLWTSERKWRSASFSRPTSRTRCHRVAQPAAEFSSCRPTAAGGLRPQQSRPPRREPHWTIVVAMSHQSCCVVLLVPGPVAFAARIVVRLLIWVSSSPLAQDNSRCRPYSRSVATRPSRHVSVPSPLVSIPVTTCHGSRAPSKDARVLNDLFVCFYPLVVHCGCIAYSSINETIAGR